MPTNVAEGIALLKVFLLTGFLKLAEIESASDVAKLREISPTTPGQLEVQMTILRMLEQLGITDAMVDEKGYLYAHLPANLPEGQVADPITLVYHADTTSSAKPENGEVHPQVIENYPGGNIVLQNGHVITATGSALEKLVGDTLVTGDGTCRIGADDKAGAMIALAVFKYYLEHPTVLHPDIYLIGAPDEEVGGQVRYINLERVHGHVFTLDGGELGEYSVETFNARRATVKVTGFDCHPGEEGKKKPLVNSMQVMARIIAQIEAAGQLPELTEGRQPFIMVSEIGGNVGSTTAHFILRAFDKATLNNLNAMLQECCQWMKLNYYPRATIELLVEDSYDNMLVYLPGHERTVQILLEAMKLAGIEALLHPIRGGTDGSRFSKLGYFCPNLFTGMHNIHSIEEVLSIGTALKAVQVVINMATISVWGHQKD